MAQFLLCERDGVITVRKDEGITSADECLILPFVQEALFTLEQKGIATIVLSDQSKLVPQTISLETLDEIHARMKEIAEEQGGLITDVISSPNSAMALNLSQFPKPGLFVSAAKKYGFKLPETWFIASSWEGLQAGWSAGCKTIFVKTGKPFRALENLRTSQKQPNYIVQDILTAIVKAFPG